MTHFPQNDEYDPKEGRVYKPPEIQCTPARLECLWRSGGHESSILLRNSDGSDGMDWVAPSLPPLSSQELSVRKLEHC